MMTTTTVTDTTTPHTARAKPQSKSAAVIKLLGRARGATVAELQTTTSWQPHSVRAFLSGLRKAGRKLDKEERKSGETSYRFVAEVTTVLDAARATASTADNPHVDGAFNDPTTANTNAEPGA